MFDEPRLAFSFLSRVPLGGKGNVKNIARYFTLVGYGAGLIYWVGCRYIHGDLGALLTIVTGFLLFDLFHFDGLLDTFDGFFNQAGREKCLEIMSKGDTGPFAIFFSFFYCLAFFLAFRSSTPEALLFVSVCGRFSMNILLAFTQPAKPGGLGALMSPYDNRSTVWSAVLAAPLIAISFAMGRIHGRRGGCRGSDERGCSPQTGRLYRRRSRLGLPAQPTRCADLQPVPSLNRIGGATTYERAWMKCSV